MVVSGKLTDKQELFCREYVKDPTGSAAYRRAYPAVKSDQAAKVNASRLLTHANVRARIDQLRKECEKRTEVDTDRIIKEYARLAFLDIRKAFDADGNLKPIHDLDDDTAAAIAGLEVEEIREWAGDPEESLEDQPHGGALKRGRGKQTVGRLKKVKLSDKKGALDSLARIKGLFTDKLEVAGKDGKDLNAPPTDEEVQAAVEMAFRKMLALQEQPEGEAT
jgi:phage terminase small subunit